jgi:predicted nucleotidyltransferase
MGHPASRPLAELLDLTFGPRVVVAEEFDVPGADRVVIFGSWASRYEGEVGLPPHDIDVLVVGEVDRADVYEAAERAQARLGLEVNPVVRSPHAWGEPVDELVVQIKGTAHTVVIGGDQGES